MGSASKTRKASPPQHAHRDLDAEQAASPSQYLSVDADLDEDFDAFTGKYELASAKILSLDPDASRLWQCELRHCRLGPPNLD